MIKRDRFLTIVEQCLGGGMPPGVLAEDEAARTCHAVLRALALRLSRADRRRLLHELPEGLGSELAVLDVQEGEPSSGDTIGRVAGELGVDRAVAARRVCCVVGVIHETVAAETWRELAGELGPLEAGGPAAQPGWG